MEAMNPRSLSSPRHACWSWSQALLAVFVYASLGCSASPENRVQEAAGQDDEPHTGAQVHEEGVVRLSPEAAARAGIRTAPVVERILEGLIETTGSVDFNQDTLAHVSPRVAGRVESAPARLGAQVEAGEVMARIDSIELGQARADYLQAKARGELARENHEREQRLFADRISSEQEMLAARAADRQAQAALRAAEETLHLYGLTDERIRSLHYDDPQASIYAVRAPFPGRVVEKHVTLGELVTPQSKLFLLADLRQVWIWIDVFERDLARVHLGDGVAVRVESYPDTVFRGQVSYLSARVDPGTRVVRARIDADNAGEKLRSGMFARVQISDPHAAQDAVSTKSVVVPDSALQRAGENFIAFVAAGERRFEKRTVRLGRRAGDFVEILEGLVAGEQVIVEGAFILKSEASKEKLGGGHGH